MKEMKDVTLDNVAGGAAPELFDHAWAEVLENVADINREADATREIKLTFKIDPSGDRETLAVVCVVDVKLAKRKAGAAAAHLGRRNGQLVALTYDVRQGSLFDEDVDPSVTPINDRREAKA